nr:uncharacterized protein LOC110141643 isoform X2 [Odocoileus virginianus texanus]
MAGGRPAAPPVSLKHRGAVVCYIPEGRLMTAGLLSHETLVSSLITAGSGRHPRKTRPLTASGSREPQQDAEGQRCPQALGTKRNKSGGQKAPSRPTARWIPARTSGTSTTEVRQGHILPARTKFSARKP